MMKKRVKAKKTVTKKNTFLSGLTTNDAFTENAMPAHSTTDSALVDMFFNLGTRNLDNIQILKLLSAAVAADERLARKILFYNRDPRGGRGERASFRLALMWLLTQKPQVVAGFLKHVPEFGRWDDLILLAPEVDSREINTVIKAAWKAGDRLLAKWLPRKGKEAVYFRTLFGLTPKAYRKRLVAMTNVVETPMCAGDWKEIDFSKVPSQAGRIYSKAFSRHEPERYAEWKAELAKPEEERDKKVKINVGVLYPHEILAKLGYAYPVQEAWDALKKKYPQDDGKTIAVCDVSGSMTGLPMDVSIALGLFLSELNTGPFKDCFITFSAEPKLQKLSGTLAQKAGQLNDAEWGMNTNLEAVFNLIVKAAKKADKKDVPTTILILSDMQFDACVQEPNNNALEMIDRQFAELGLKRPNVVFWNLRAVMGTNPVKADQKGTALVSGFSPSTLETILKSPGDMTPMGLMLTAINAKRYAVLD